MPIATFAVSNWGGSRLKGVTRRLGLFLLCWGWRQVDKETDTCHRQRGSESLPLRALLDGVVLTCQTCRYERDRSRCGVVRRIVDLDDHRRWRFAAAGKGEYCVRWIISKQRLPAVGEQLGADQAGIAERSV